MEEMVLGGGYKHSADFEDPTMYFCHYNLKKNLNASRPSEHPQSGGKMSKR